MSVLEKYNIQIDKEFDETEIINGTYIVISYATRIPPHIGMVIAGYYNALTIKGQDINLPVEALLKNINIRKIPTLFVKIKPHDFFNEVYLKNRFIEKINLFPRVDLDVATCLSPVKLFLGQEFNFNVNKINFIYELLPFLESKMFIENISSLFINKNGYNLPLYSQEDIDNEIRAIR